jgi:hypothetical protein
LPDRLRVGQHRTDVRDTLGQDLQPERTPAHAFGHGQRGTETGERTEHQLAGPRVLVDERRHRVG